MNYSFDLVGNILGYSNTTGTYSTSQSYGYDSLYQLTSAQGSSSSHPNGLTDWTSTYKQSFSFDAIGNMTQKNSSVNTVPSRSVGDGLNYGLNYSYYAGKAHQAEIIGDLYYRYDANGNTIEERQGGHGTGIVLGGTVSRNGDLRMTDRGFGLVLTEPGTPAPTVYSREFVWDEENRLQRTVDGNLTLDYRYGADGQRAVKYSSRGESLYFDSMWQAQTDAPSLRQSKHIYVGSTRTATQLNIQGQLDVGYETVNTYYYHPDHLGSSQLVTDYQGNQYEHVEYTPYGESWIDQETDSRALLPYKFTSKELDSETGLYYYGARYLNPRTSRWVSADPAMGGYLPVAPASDEARKHNQNLPGMGGVFNLVNLSVFTYASNNPVRYVDPSGFQVYEMPTPEGPVPVPFVPGGDSSGTLFQPITRGMLRDFISDFARAWSAWTTNPREAFGNANRNFLRDVLGIELPQKAQPASNYSEIRGLPPKGVVPPVEHPENLKQGPASRPAERAKGGQSLWEPTGGEWRYVPEDPHHNPHWDYNPHDTPNSEWKNVPIGGLPPVKD